jgi:hypothetical protein
MNQLFHRIYNYLADDIFKIRRYSSIINSPKKITKSELALEKKHLQDINFLVSTVEDCLFAPENENSKEDFKYLELIEKINSTGENSLTVDEVNFLNTYRTNNS